MSGSTDSGCIIPFSLDEPETSGAVAKAIGWLNLSSMPSIALKKTAKESCGPCQNYVEMF